MKRWLKKIIPQQKSLQNHPHLSRISHLLNRPHIWALHRRSCARAAAIGVFINFLPLPLQMLWAGLLAILLRANLPIAVAITWINNPFTFIPINLFVYFTGEKILTLLGFTSSSSEQEKLSFEQLTSLHWIDGLYSLGIPYITGLLFLCIIGSIFAYLLISIIWKIAVLKRRRKHRPIK